MDRRDAVELRLLRAFVVLAEELNFGRAAERLHVTQPALSAQLRQLEDRLGFALFDRSTRRVTLTSQGATLLTPARTLLAESNRFADAVAREATVPVLIARIGGVAPGPVGITRLVVPLDGSPAAEESLPVAEEISRRLGHAPGAQAAASK